MFCRCITFGSPRVGNLAFQRAFHSLVGTSLRLVHGRDPVPSVPPAVMCGPPDSFLPCLWTVSHVVG